MGTSLIRLDVGLMLRGVKLDALGLNATGALGFCIDIVLGFAATGALVRGALGFATAFEVVGALAGAFLGVVD